MNKYISILLFTVLYVNGHAAKNQEITMLSPDKKIAVVLNLNTIPTYRILFKQDTLIEESALGLVLENADLHENLKYKGEITVSTVDDAYEMHNDKKIHNNYVANRTELVLHAKKAYVLRLIFQISNDGVAFRYRVEGEEEKNVKVNTELTTFNLPDDAMAWLLPHAKAQTGWANTQPSYEEYYQKGITVGNASPTGQGWSLPALFTTKNNWMLISEADMPYTYCGSHLSQESPNGEYSIAFAQDEETTGQGNALLPQGRLPLISPWRIFVIGNSLSTIVESTLTTDVSSKSIIKETSFIKPGKSSWSWVLLKDGATVYEVQKKFIDYASEMNWQYCLIDALWDSQIGYDKINELAAYAKTKKVDLILWYNSNGNWNEAFQTPTKILFDAESRSSEFKRISEMGIKGLKIDFFGGDGQSFMAYYQDLLMDAAKFNLLVNFHGTTIPRGWNRTYPNLMTMEAVRGFEFLTFAQENTDNEATHCTVLPFTRNAVGPMDFTPVCFSEIPNLKRHTSNAFQLALSVIFQSGIQHYAEIPEGMKRQPGDVIEFMKTLPAEWEDVRFLEGYPGKYVVLARKYKNKWFVAGINSSGEDIQLKILLSDLGNFSRGIVITDGENYREFKSYRLTHPGEFIIILKQNGGFVLELFE